VPRDRVGLSMLNVYLDQNKWIDVSNALNGDERAAQFRDVALAVQASIEDSYASYPLSAAHIFELWKKARAGPRQRLGKTMAEISKNDAILPPWLMLPPELDRALSRRFGRLVTPLPLEPFGKGMRHRGGASAPDLPNEIRDFLREARPNLNDDQLADWMDEILLAGPDEDMRDSGIPLPPLEFAQAFADSENAQMKLLAEKAADRATRKQVACYRALVDIKVPIDEALARAGIPWDPLIELGEDGMTEFMLDLPSRAAGLELMWLGYENPETEWKPNDMADLGYLSAAVAYCDVVVTERKWTALLMTRTEAPERFGTTVIRNLNDLAPLLDAARTDCGQ
jgi:hypothetical protein